MGTKSLKNIVSDKEGLYRKAIERVKRVYKHDSIPWIIGYSGGKDSTATCTVVLKALAELDKEELTKNVYIISSDTLVETPLIINEIDATLFKIEAYGRRNKMPISTHKVQPRFDNTFWSNIIGRGYPSPNQTFRWCTDRMKIDPANQFVKDIVAKNGEAIMVLGVRKGESNSRDRVLESHSIEKSDLMKHSTLTNAFTFAPIIEFDVDDVWNLLLNYPCPWGGDNQKLFKLYSDSNANTECPLMIDQETKNMGSCGNSRFGCWVCTVVNEDKSLSGFIRNGVKWLKPLLEYRNWLYSIRDDRTLRMKKRATGQIYFAPIKKKDDLLIIPKKGDREKIEISLKTGIDNNEEKWNIFERKNDAIKYIKDNRVDLSSSSDPKIICRISEGYGQLGVGPFTFECRKEMLRKLLLLQKLIKEKYDINHKLIKREELLAISKLWLEQGYWDDDVCNIYKEVLGEELDFISDDIKLLNEKDRNILKDICIDNSVDFELVKKLLFLEKNSYGLTRRNNMQKDLARLLNQDYIHI